MAPFEDPSADDWRARASERFKSSKRLISGNRWQDAYDLAGQAVEMALKYKIMRVHGLNRWPDRQDRPDLYVHDLGSLLASAGLQEMMLSEVSKLSERGRAWMTIKDWSVDVRYPIGTKFPSRRARDMVEAVGKMGVLEWLLS